MIYQNHSEFLKALDEFVKLSIQDPACHKHTAAFEFGDTRRGFGLTANNAGWSATLEGVQTHGFKRIAAPLGNLQAAYAALH